MKQFLFCHSLNHDVVAQECSETRLRNVSNYPAMGENDQDELDWLIKKGSEGSFVHIGRAPQFVAVRLPDRVEFDDTEPNPESRYH